MEGNSENEVISHAAEVFKEIVSACVNRSSPSSCRSQLGGR